MTPHFEMFEHTADLGVRVQAPTLAELVVPATEGLYATIGELATTGDRRAHTIELSGDDPALLLRDYLAEVLRLFDAEKRRLVDVDVREFADGNLIVQAESAAIDAAGSALEREVKAVTYHELGVRSVAGGYELTFIVDI